KLWSGDTSEYGSQSEAELALCSMLTFWTGPDPERIDRLFRRSALYREKWDEPHYSDGRTYGEGTIAKALDGAEEFYKAPSDEKQPSQATIILRLAKDAELFHTADGEADATIVVDNHRETWQLRTKAFK